LATPDNISPAGKRPRGRPPGDKREQILRVAPELFARYGYRKTRWGDVGAAVGLQGSGLYYYFESKLHCLYEVIGSTIVDWHDRFDEITTRPVPYEDRLVEVLFDTYDLTDEELLKTRVVVAEWGRVAIRRSSGREEQARLDTRARIQELEYAWGTFLARGMEESVVTEDDPQVLTRALLGLRQSIWYWYEPGGRLTLDDLAAFYVRRQLALLGAPATLVDAAGRGPGEPEPEERGSGSGSLGSGT
jgi:TetR/AcrR family transcriptional regulator, cholesterol catabolism regulator